MFATGADQEVDIGLPPRVEVSFHELLVHVGWIDVSRKQRPNGIDDLAASRVVESYVQHHSRPTARALLGTLD